MRLWREGRRAARTFADEPVWASAFFIPECRNFELPPRRSEIPGVYVAAPSDSTGSDTPAPLRLKPCVPDESIVTPGRVNEAHSEATTTYTGPLTRQDATRTDFSASALQVSNTAESFIIVMQKKAIGRGMLPVVNE